MFERSRTSRRGASLLSYGLLLGLISVSALITVTSVGSSTTALFGNVGARLGGVATSQSGSSGGDGGGDTTPPSWTTPAGSLGDFSLGTSTGSLGVVATDASGIAEYRLVSGTLPDGLTLGPNDGSLVGTFHSGVIGEASFTIEAEDNAGNVSSRTFSIGIDGPLSISHTGSDQTFQVVGLSSITISAWGAGGGGSVATEGNGGGGAFVRGALALSGDTTLTVIVGEGGVQHATGNSQSAAMYGGGGSAGSSTHLGYVMTVGAGGGRSAVRVGSTEVITAAGGGGGADFNVCGDSSAAHGGAGGITGGSNGANGMISPHGFIRRGLGATTDSGGNGPGGSGGQGGFNSPGVQVAGDGTQFTGGNGNGFGGAGGGGGYYGGGGSASFNCSGGAGGGSSYIGGVTSTTTDAGSGTQVGGSLQPGYVSGIGMGGVDSDGGDGLVQLEWTLP